MRCVPGSIPSYVSVHSASENPAVNSCVRCGEGKERHREAVLQMSASYHQSTAFLRRSALALSVIHQESGPKCPICFESILSEWRAEECDEHLLCRNCVIDYVTLQVKEGKAIYCPFHDCPTVLKVKEIRKLVGTEMTEKWERKRLERNPMYHHCPIVNCSGYTLGIKETRQTFCPVCKRSLCSHCGKMWHPDISCRRVLRREIKNLLATKACPRCLHFIEKSQRYHMTCQLCLHEWCLLCRHSYTETHYSPDSLDYCPTLTNPLKTKARSPVFLSAPQPPPVLPSVRQPPPVLPFLPQSPPVLPSAPKPSPRHSFTLSPETKMYLKWTLCCCTCPLWLTLMLLIDLLFILICYVFWVCILFLLLPKIIEGRNTCLFVYMFVGGLIMWPVLPPIVATFFTENYIWEQVCRGD